MQALTDHDIERLEYAQRQCAIAEDRRDEAYAARARLWRELYLRPVSVIEIARAAGTSKQIVQRVTSKTRIAS